MTNLIHSHCIQYDLYITSSIHLSHNITEITGTCIPNGNKQWHFVKSGELDFRVPVMVFIIDKEIILNSNGSILQGTGLQNIVTFKALQLQKY